MTPTEREENTMRYNLSEIMKNAWTLKKACEGMTLSEALKNAWSKAKETAVKVKTAVGKHIQILTVAKWVLRKMETRTFMALESGIAIDDITLERETEKAIEISTEWNYERIKIWLPKSACTYKFA